MTVFKAIPAELFADLERFRAKSDPRPPLMGVNVRLSKTGVLTAQAGDGACFMENTLHPRFWGGSGSFILRGSSLRALRQSGKYEEDCLFEFDEDLYQLDISDVRYDLVTDYKYPDYERVFNSSWQPAWRSVKSLRDHLCDGNPVERVQVETEGDAWITVDRKKLIKGLQVALKRQNPRLHVNTEPLQYTLKITGDNFRMLLAGEK